MSIGGCVGYFTGDPLRLMDDAQALKPHIFPSVPRVLNRVYQAAMTAGDVPGLKGAIFRTALQAKLDQLHKTGVKTHALWDALVFRKVCGGFHYFTKTYSLTLDSCCARWQRYGAVYGFCTHQCGSH